MYCSISPVRRAPLTDEHPIAPGAGPAVVAHGAVGPLRPSAPAASCSPGISAMYPCSACVAARGRQWRQCRSQARPERRSETSGFISLGVGTGSSSSHWRSATVVAFEGLLHERQLALVRGDSERAGRAKTDFRHLVRQLLPQLARPSSSPSSGPPARPPTHTSPKLRTLALRAARSLSSGPRGSRCRAPTARGSCR